MKQGLRSWHQYPISRDSQVFRTGLFIIRVTRAVRTRDLGVGAVIAVLRCVPDGLRRVRMTQDEVEPLWSMSWSILHLVICNQTLTSR